jgi:hypothetical protein
MNSAALLLLLLAPIVQVDEVAAKRPLLVFIDGSRESQILKSELTRDWASRPSAELAIWEARRQRVASRIRIIDLSSIPRYKRPDVGLPAYAWGEFEKPTPLDSRSFNGSGCALTCVETHIFNFDLDLTSWVIAKDTELEIARWSHVQKVANWLAKDHPDDWSSYPWCPYENHLTVEKLEKKFGDYPDYPRFVPPPPPESPIRKFPWESR